MVLANVPLIVPADAVRQLQTDAPYVMVLRGDTAADTAARVPVRVGVQTQGRVQILEGLAPGDRSGGEHVPGARAEHGAGWRKFGT